MYWLDNLFKKRLYQTLDQNQIVCGCCFDYLLFLSVPGLSSGEQIFPALGVDAGDQICQRDLLFSQ